MEIDISQSIAIENGSGMVKAGFAGEDSSCAVFSSIVAYLSYSSQMIDVNISKSENAVFQKAYAFSAFVISFSPLICTYFSFYCIEIVFLFSSSSSSLSSPSSPVPNQGSHYF